MRFLNCKLIPLLTLLLTSIFIPGYAQQANTKTPPPDVYSFEDIDDTIKLPESRPDGYAPLGVTGDHLNEKNKLLISYFFTDCNFEGEQQGTTHINSNQVFSSYQGAVTSMSIQKSNIRLLYGCTDKFNLELIINSVSNNLSMNIYPSVMLRNANGTEVLSSSVTATNSSLGDTKLSALYQLLESKKSNLLLGLGVSLPTGSIQQKTRTVIGDTLKTNYAMQTGSGSLGILPSLLYKGYSDQFSWGGLINATLFTGANSEGYKVGNQYIASIYGAYKISSYLSVSLRGAYSYTGKISGYDPDIIMFAWVDPMAAANNYGASIATTYVGFNFFIPTTDFKRLRISFELGDPLYQNLDGIQPTSKLSINAGISYQL